MWVSEVSSSHSLFLLQHLGCIVLSLPGVVQENMCCVTLDQGEVQRGTCPKIVASPYVLQRNRSTSCLTPHHMASPSSLSACPHLNGQPRTPYVTSYPSPPMMCNFCQFPCIFYLVLAAIFSQGKSSQGRMDIWDGHPPPASQAGTI